MSGASNLRIQFSATDPKGTGSIHLLRAVSGGVNQGIGNYDRYLDIVAGNDPGVLPAHERNMQLAAGSVY